MPMIEFENWNATKKIYIQANKIIGCTPYEREWIVQETIDEVRIKIDNAL